ncbi:MAG: DUF1772 domain-containing protein [Phycisphaerales bacterium JB063]
MNVFPILLVLATLLCSLVSGFLFAFAVVVMPGIRALDDGGFIRAFQVMDRVIQNNQPVFVLTWLGSVVALVGAAAVGFGQLDRVGRVLMLSAVAVYLLGVQLPTLAVNVPLNNRLQSVEVETLDAPALHNAREAFEPRWNRWNLLRTLLSVLVAAALIVQVLRL